MSRPPKVPEIQNRIQLRFNQHSFLRVVDEHCPEVFENLRHEVAKAREIIRQGLTQAKGWEPGDEQSLPADMIKQLLRSPIERWGAAFNVTGSWIEAQAYEFSCIWIAHPGTLADSVLPLAVRSESTGESAAEFHIAIPIPLELGFARPYFKWSELEEYLALELVPAFTQELERLKQRALDSGVIKSENVPGNKDKKMAFTALYLFRNLSPEEIATTVPGFARERSVLNRWINETTRFLQLEPVRKLRVAHGRKTSAHSGVSHRHVAAKRPGR